MKTKNQQRVEKNHQKKIDAGLKRVTVWVPIAQVEKIKAVADLLCKLI